MAAADVSDEKQCASALAVAWEKEHSIRRKAVKLQVVPQSSQVNFLIPGRSVRVGNNLAGFDEFKYRCLKLYSSTLPSKVSVFGQSITRDTLKNNRTLLALAVKFLGLRVTVPTCQMHIKALYDYMDISCPGTLFLYIWHVFFEYLWLQESGEWAVKSFHIS